MHGTAFDNLQRMERYGDWSVRVWRYEHPTRGLIEPPVFWYEVVDRHISVRCSAPAFTSAEAGFSAGMTGLVDEQALARAAGGALRRGVWLTTPPQRQHDLAVVLEMLRGGDVDGAIAHAEEALRG